MWLRLCVSLDVVPQLTPAAHVLQYGLGVVLGAIHTLFYFILEILPRVMIFIF